MALQTQRVPRVLLLALVGLAAWSTGAATKAIPRALPELHDADGSSDAVNAQVPQPTPTIHVHVSFRGTVWDGVEDVPLAGARVAITACGGYAYELTTGSEGGYDTWLPTEGEFLCGAVPFEVSAADHETVRRTVPYRQYLFEDFVLKPIAASVLYLPSVSAVR